MPWLLTSCRLTPVTFAEFISLVEHFSEFT